MKRGEAKNGHKIIRIAFDLIMKNIGETFFKLSQFNENVILTEIYYCGLDFVTQKDCCSSKLNLS